MDLLYFTRPDERMPTQIPSSKIPVASIVTALARDRERYLAFVQRRLRDKALSEDILQMAFVRATEKADSLRSVDTMQGWFYGILRNAVIDAQRRSASSARTLAFLAGELSTVIDTKTEATDPCHCVAPLAQNLKPEYRDALYSIEVEGKPVKEFAEEQGLSANHAGVRVHRARKALKEKVKITCGSCASAGCQNCTCAH